MKSYLPIITAFISIFNVLAMFVGLPLYERHLERKCEKAKASAAKSRRPLPPPVTTTFADGSSVTISYAYEVK